MRNKYLIFFLLLSVLSSCTKDFEEINTNPNDPEQVPMTTLLLSGITRSVDRIGGASMNMTYSGLWAQHYSKIQYIDEDYYQFRESAMTAHWDGLYAGPVLDLQVIIDNEEASDNMKAAAMTMKAYIMSVVTDMWGSVPYTEALDPINYPQPKYDTQDVIYSDLIAQLGAAASMFSADGGDLGAGDVLYGGDVTMWKKFANSLRLRLANRAVAKDASLVGVISEILGSGDYISSNEESAILSYPGAVPYENPLFENAKTRDDHGISKTMVDLLTALDDPRLPMYANVNEDGEYVGQPNGGEQPANLFSVSRIGDMFRQTATAPIPIMTYDEVLFIIAERENDKQMYLDGITASMERYGLTPSTEYMDLAGSQYDSNAKKAVITHKWISLFGNGAEAFTEYRRTGYPEEVQEVPLSAYPGLGVPHRFAYSSIEFSVNSANVEAAQSAQNLDLSAPLHGDKMWWAE